MANEPTKPVDNNPAGKSPAQAVTSGLGKAIDKSKKTDAKGAPVDVRKAAKEEGLLTSGLKTDYTV